MKVKRTFSILILFLLMGCTTSGSSSGPISLFDTGPLSGKYTGQDAGYLVVTIAAQAGTVYSDYLIYFRKKDRSDDGTIWWGQQNPHDQRKLDIKNDEEQGIVDVRRLPPGDYEIFNVDTHLNGGLVQMDWKSKSDFSIPFTIATGRASYIGEMMAVDRKGAKNLFGMPVRGGAYFVLTDKSARDLPIAKAKEPGIGEVAIQVPNAKVLANSYIRDTAQ